MKLDLLAYQERETIIKITNREVFLKTTQKPVMTKLKKDIGEPNRIYETELGTFAVEYIRPINHADVKSLLKIKNLIPRSTRYK